MAGLSDLNGLSNLNNLMCFQRGFPSRTAISLPLVRNYNFTLQP